MARPRALRVAMFLTACLIFADLPAVHASQASDERSLMSSINRERTRRGVASLRSSGELAAVARRHSARMAASRRVYHNRSLRSQTSGWASVGENVGAGTSASAIHSAMMRDAQHRNIILDRRYTHAGVGVAYHGSTLYVTEVFGVGSVAAPKPRVSRPQRPSRRAVARPQPPPPVVKPVPPPPPAPPIRSVSVILRLLALDEPIRSHAPPPRRRGLD